MAQDQPEDPRTLALAPIRFLDAHSAICGYVSASTSRSGSGEIASPEDGQGKETERRPVVVPTEVSEQTRPTTFYSPEVRFAPSLASLSTRRPEARGTPR